MSLLTKASLILTPNAYKANKLYSIVPSSGLGDMTITRSSPYATRTNSYGVIENIGANIPRLNYDSIGGNPYILIEPQRTNLLLNSATLATQSVTTTATSYVISFYGTGTVALSGAYVGTLVGIGTSTRVTLIFTSTASPLALTVSGSCTNAQLEAGTFSTSYIPTTSSAITRNADIISKSGATSLIGQTEGVLYCDFIYNHTPNNYPSIVLLGTATDSIYISVGITGFYYIGVKKASVSQLNFNSYPLPTIGTRNKVAISYKDSNIKVYINGVLRFTQLSGTIPTCDVINLRDLTWGGEYPLNSVQLYKTQLTDAECITLTTL